jgi:hypothetical protein
MNAKITDEPALPSGASRTPAQGALKLKGACQYLGGISPASLRRLINRGLLKPNRALRHLVFPIAELDRFLLERQR